jgi:hypothetical protein
VGASLAESVRFPIVGACSPVAAFMLQTMGDRSDARQTPEWALYSMSWL